MPRHAFPSRAPRDLHVSSGRGGERLCVAIVVVYYRKVGRSPHVLGLGAWKSTSKLECETVRNAKSSNLSITTSRSRSDSNSRQIHSRDFPMLRAATAASTSPTRERGKVVAMQMQSFLPPPSECGVIFPLEHLEEPSTAASFQRESMELLYLRGKRRRRS